MIAQSLTTEQKKTNNIDACPLSHIHQAEKENIHLVLFGQFIMNANSTCAPIFDLIQRKTEKGRKKGKKLRVPTCLSMA